MFGGRVANKAGNGHGVNTPDFWQDYSQPNEFPSALKEFIEPGKDMRNLLMRTIFKDAREANAFVNYMANVRDAGLEKESAGDALLDWLATRVSIGGVARRELLMAVANIIAPSLYPGMSGQHMKNQKRDNAPDDKDD